MISCLAFPNRSSLPPAPTYFNIPVMMPKKPKRAANNITGFKMEIKFCTNWVRFVGLSPNFHCAKVKSGNRPYENTKSTNIRKFTKTDFSTHPHFVFVRIFVSISYFCILRGWTRKTSRAQLLYGTAYNRRKNFGAEKNGDADNRPEKSRFGFA